MTPAAALVNPRPLACPACAAPWGEESAAGLDVGPVLILQRVPLRCRGCGFVWGYRPRRGGNLLDTGESVPSE